MSFGHIYVSSFSLPGRSPGRAIVLPPASALVLASASALVSLSLWSCDTLNT